MSAGSMDGSPGVEIIGTPGREMDASPQATSDFSYQKMRNRKFYFGYRVPSPDDPYSQPWALPSWFGETAPGIYDIQWWPSVSFRQSFRKRYAQVDLSANHSIAQSSTFTYSATGTLSGSGLTPVGSGMPGSINPADGSFTGSAPLENYYYWAFTGYSGGTDPAPTPHIDSQSFTALAWHMTGHDPLNPDPSSIDNEYDYSGTVSSLRSFSGDLSVAAVEIQGLSWPTYSAWDVTYEKFKDWKEYGSWSSATPADYDGTAVSDYTATFSPITDPFFGSDASRSFGWAEASLWTGWLFPSNEEDASNHGSISSDSIAIYCERTRFTAATAEAYFIAEATVTRAPGTTGAGTADDLTDVVIKTSGTTSAGTVYEIGWPTDTGYDDAITVTLPVKGVSTLSMGKIRFAILGETPAAWSARTGIPYT